MLSRALSGALSSAAQAVSRVTEGLWNQTHEEHSADDDAELQDAPGAQRSQAQHSADAAAPAAPSPLTAASTRVKIVRAAPPPTPAQNAVSVRIVDNVAAAAGSPIDPLPLPLPPLLKAPRSTPLYGYPCQISCSAWLQPKKVLPAIHAVILMHMQSHRRRRTTVRRQSGAPAAAASAVDATAAASAHEQPRADSDERMQDEAECSSSHGDDDECCSPELPPALPLTVRLPVYTRLLDVLTAQLDRAESQPASIVASIQASQQLHRGVVAPGVCTLLPELYAVLLAELHSPAHSAAATADPADLRLSVELRLAVLRVLAFLLRDGHFASQFAHLGVQAEQIVAALLLQIDLAAAVEPSRSAAAALAGEHLTPLQLALVSLDLFTFSALPWTHLLSLLPDVLACVQRLLLFAVAAGVHDTALTLLVVRHALGFLGAVWSRGMPWFLHRAVPSVDAVVPTSLGEREVLCKYQQCVGIILRIDWTQLWSRSQTQRASQQPATFSSSSAAAAPTVHWLDTYAAALSSASSSSFVASVSNLHRYALQLVRSWPHPAAFHAHALPINAPGLSVGLIRELPSASMIVPVLDTTATATAAASSAAAVGSPAAADLEHAAFFAPIIDQQGFLQLSLQDRAARRMQWTHVRALYLRAKEENRKRSGSTIISEARIATSAGAASSLNGSATSIEEMQNEDEEDEGPCAIIGPAARSSSTRAASRSMRTRSLLPSASTPTATSAPPAVSPDVTALRQIDVSSLPASAQARTASSNRLALLARLLSSLPAHSVSSKHPDLQRAKQVLQTEIKALRGRIGPAVEQVMWSAVLANNATARAQAVATTPQLSTLMEQLPFLPLTRQTAPVGTGKLAAVAPREQRSSSKVQHHDSRIARQGGTIGLAATIAGTATGAIAMEQGEAEQFAGTDACVDMLRSAGPAAAESEGSFPVPATAASAATTAASISADPADWSTQIKQSRFTALPNRFYATVNAAVVSSGAASPSASPDVSMDAVDSPTPERSTGVSAATAVADSPAARSGGLLGYTRMGEQELAAAMASELQRQGPAAAEIEANMLAHAKAVEKLLAIPSASAATSATPAAAPPSLPLLADSLGHSPALPQSTNYTTLLSGHGGSGGSRGNYPVPDSAVFEFLPYFGDEAAPSEYIDSGLYSNILKPGEEPTDEEEGDEDEDAEEEEEEANQEEGAIDLTMDVEISENKDGSNGSSSSNKRQKIDAAPLSAAASVSSAASASAAPAASSASQSSAGRRKPTAPNSFAPSRQESYEYAPSSSRSERKRLVDEIILLYFARRLHAHSLQIGPRVSSMLACELVSLQLASAQAVRSKIQELEACVRDDAAASASSASSSTAAAQWSAPLASDALNTFESLWCRRCFVYDCRKHGLNQPRACVTLGIAEVAAATVADQAAATTIPPAVAAQPLLISRRIPTDSQLRSMGGSVELAAVGSKRKRRQRTEEEEESKEGQPRDNDAEAMTDALPTPASTTTEGQAPCGPSCFTLASRGSSPAASAARSWTDLDRALLRQLFFVTKSVLNSASVLVRAEMQRPAHVPAVCAASADWRSESADSGSLPLHSSCRVAALMGDRSCVEVAAECAAQGITAFHGQEAVAAASSAIQTANAAIGSTLTAAPTLERKASVTSLSGAHSKDPPSAPASGCSQLVLGKRMSLVAFSRRIKEISNQHRDLPLHFKPCAHEGRLCDEDCHCVRFDLFCERFCGCAESCHNKFIGCRCPPGKCATLLCTCFQAQRECDPDLCRCECEVECDPVLYARAVQKAAEKGEVLRPRCGNVCVLSGRAHPLLLGRSATHGWGAFLGPSPTALVGHPSLSAYASASPPDLFTEGSLPPGLGGLPKLRFVAEYNGELISHTEADRRGKIYDYRNRSYLFNLNDEYVVDAARKGNKTKFANHAPVDPVPVPAAASASEDAAGAAAPPLAANCYPRIVLVRGDHRIGLFSRRRIQPGEEILFDYKHDHEPSATHETNAPTWFRPLMAAGATEESSSAASSNRKGMGSSSGSGSHHATAGTKKKTATTTSSATTATTSASGMASSSSSNAARKRGGGSAIALSTAPPTVAVSRSSSSASVAAVGAAASKPPPCPPAASAAAGASSAPAFSPPLPLPPAVSKHQWIKQLTMEPKSHVRRRARSHKQESVLLPSSAVALEPGSNSEAPRPPIAPVAPAAPAAPATPAAASVAATSVSFSFAAPPLPPPPSVLTVSASPSPSPSPASTSTLPLSPSPTPVQPSMVPLSSSSSSSCASSSQAVHSATVTSFTTTMTSQPGTLTTSAVMAATQHAAPAAAAHSTPSLLCQHPAFVSADSAVAASSFVASSAATAATVASSAASTPPAALSTSRLAGLAVSATKAALAALDLEPPTRRHTATGRRKGRPTNAEVLERAQAQLVQLQSMGAQ